MGKPRKQTYTMEMYLNKIRDKDIRNDADVQRHFVWSNEQVNELIVTALTDDYIPPIILGENDGTQLWIVDGGQRSSALNKYRYGNYKITSSIENSVISYKAKARDGKGNIKTDREGNLIWEDATFDIKNKTYERLPDELKKRFNEYQIETVIHEQCDMHRISKYIKKYNNHASMNTLQKAFTYIDRFAKDIREMIHMRFFLDYSVFTDVERTKGMVERVIVETIMCMNHLDHWKKQTKAICTYLNQNAEKKEFERLADHLQRLESVITEDVKDIFNSKDSFLFLTLFDRFTKLGMEDGKFAEFLRAFKNHLRKTVINGVLFDEIDKGKGTKDKAVIVSKLEMLENLMYGFFQIPEGSLDRTKLFDFIRKKIALDVEPEDLEQYEEVLDELLAHVDSSSKLMDQRNRFSLTALVAYSFQMDIDLDQWIVDFFGQHEIYIDDQEKNFFYMKEDLDRYTG